MAKAQPIDTAKIARQQLAEMIIEAQALIKQGKILKQTPMTPRRRRACLDDELRWVRSDLAKTLDAVSGKQSKILTALRQMALPYRLDFIEALVVCAVPGVIDFLNEQYAQKYGAGMEEEALAAALANHNDVEIAVHKKIYAHCMVNELDPSPFLRGEALTDFDPALKTFDISKIVFLETNYEDCADRDLRFDEKLRKLNVDLSKVRALQEQIQGKGRALSADEQVSAKQLESRVSKIESRIKEVTAEKEQNSKRRALFNQLINTAQNLLIENDVDYKQFI